MLLGDPSLELLRRPTSFESTVSDASSARGNAPPIGSTRHSFYCPVSIYGLIEYQSVLFIICSVFQKNRFLIIIKHLHFP